MAIHVKNNHQDEFNRDEYLYRVVEEIKDYAFFLMDTGGHILTWNKGAERLLGYQDSEVLGKFISFLFPPEDVEGGTPERELKKAETEGRVSDDCWLLKKDGSRFWASMTISSILDKSGGLQGFVNIVSDFTDRALTEEALRKSEERRHIISELISDYAYSFRAKADGTFVREWVTAAFTRITGYTPEEFDILGWEHLVHPHDRAHVTARLEAVFAGQYDDREFRIITKSGETRWLRDRMQAIRDSVDNHIIRVYGAGQDITRRKEAEFALERARDELEARVQEKTYELSVFNEALRVEIREHRRVENSLRESESKYRTLVEQASDGIIIFDVQGDLIELNSKFCEILGYSREELLTFNLKNIIP
ncbi:MAG TPA: PAS domain S-box protein, partial [Blastocatellia bacterium]|nr:PAS domain S-box protein [Blastocatellia bacterium]